MAIFLRNNFLSVLVITREESNYNLLLELNFLRRIKHICKFYYLQICFIYNFISKYFLANDIN